MRTFDHFPKDKICPMCGTGNDEPCALLEIDGTSDGKICEAVPVHVSCVTKGDLRYNREVGIFYKRAVNTES